MLGYFKRRRAAREERLAAFQKEHEALQNVKITSVVMRPEYFEAGRKLMHKMWRNQIDQDIIELTDHPDIRVRRVLQELATARREKGVG